MANDKKLRIAPQLENGTAEQNKSFMPMLHGKATDSIATMNSKDLTENKLNNTASVISNEVKLVIKEFDKMTGTLGISTHKLLSTAIVMFGNINNIGTKKRTLQDLKVFFPLKEYALLCGYDVEEQETSTPEEAEVEKLRAKRQLDNARRKINKDLEILYNASISWKERVRGKETDYLDTRIITSKGIRKGNILISFSPDIADYLINLPLTQYPAALLSIDERNSNAYIMGLKMAEHSNIDNNIIIKSANQLKVSTLLEITSFPSINSSGVIKNGWENRIKEPFENALDVLTGTVIESWEYSHPKGVRMKDEEATNFLSYEDWSNTLIHFTLVDAPDHTERIAKRKNS